MFSNTFRAYSVLALVAGASVFWNSGCATDRPSRNGVFNENQYLRKDFLIAAGDGSTKDEGWFVKNTVVSTSTPNPLANSTGIWTDSVGYSANYVRFAVTQDKLQIVDLKELSNDPSIVAQGTREGAVVNSWPVTNVDLKYRVNLDGERTNFYEENQELPWEQRQWVKLNFAKNDLSDLYAFGADTDPVLKKCTNLNDASVTLVPDSFNVDQPNSYFEFTLDFTVPISFSDTDAATCVAAFAQDAYSSNTWRLFQQMGRQTVSFRVKSSFVRPSKLANPAYIPFEMAEKDPILRKYGVFRDIFPFRDQTSSLLGARQRVIRWDPTKPVTYYFAPGVPQYVKDYFTTPNTGVQDVTNNQILAKSGAPIRVQFLNYNDATKLGDGQGPVRMPGDVRYTFLNWHSDLDSNVPFLGVDQPFADPRTGQLLTSDILLDEHAYRSELVPRIEFFLQQVGSEVLDPKTGDFIADTTKYPTPCKDGDSIPLVSDSIAKNFNRSSTVFNKIQSYMARPFATNGYLGPADFLIKHDDDFYNAYYKVIPYQIYSDPQANAFVTPDGSPFATAAQKQWEYFQKLAAYQKLAGDIDKGIAPFDVDGANNIKGAVDFYTNLSELQGAVADYKQTGAYSPLRRHSDTSLISYFDVFKKAGRHCVGGSWESRAAYQERLIRGVQLIAIAHEFGHGMGLAHNFMGNIDRRNFPLDANKNPIIYSSSIMEYQSKIDDAGSSGIVWGPYDIAAIGFIYGNNYDAASTGPKAPPAGAGAPSVTGQVSPTAPWNDPLGFDGTTEHQYLYCGDEQLKYTPLCAQGDVGTTPSEIVANSIVNRELNYLFNNFRLYHKYFTTENYPNQVAADFINMRRYQVMWGFDWSGGELSNIFRLVGVPVPAGANVGTYYSQLTNKFNTDMSIANQLAVAYQRAIVDQGSGERPYVTVYDPYFGDLTQQGIQLDKITATNNLTSLWLATENFDPSQATGVYMTSVGRQIGDAAYTGVSTQSLTDFLGANFATFSYAQVGPLASFAASTHSAKWPGDLTMQTWTGGWAFERERDFLDFVHAIAVKYNFQNTDENGLNPDPCVSLDHCTWDPRRLAVKTTQLTQSDRYNRFVSPDGRTYIWGYIRSRNQWVLADKDRNNATYALMLAWTTDVVNGEDSGYNGASAIEYRVRYAIDTFKYYDSSVLAAP